jgi:hypothetical protein
MIRISHQSTLGTPLRTATDTVRLDAAHAKHSAVGRGLLGWFSKQQGAAGAAKCSTRHPVERSVPWRPLAFVVAWFGGWWERHVIATVHEGDEGWAEMDESPRPFGPPRIRYFDGLECDDCGKSIIECRCGGSDA